jgi:3-isopropylmalate dehydrogenase
MYKISLITGDGIGPELSESAISVLNTINDKTDVYCSKGNRKGPS